MDIYSPPTHTYSPDFERLHRSFLRSVAANASETTARNYHFALHAFHGFLEAKGMPTDPTAISREHIEAFLLHLRRAHSPTTGKPYAPSTQKVYATTLKVFFNWLVSIDEIARSPMEKVTSRPAPEIPVKLLSDDEVTRLLKACRGNDFYSRRDLAILSLFIDTGLRLSELTSLRVSDVDWQRGTLFIRRGKGGQGRYVGLSRKAVNTLNLYQNHARHSHRESASDWLWLGRRGRLRVQGVRKAIEERAKAARIEGFHAHLLRHYWAHSCKLMGMSDEDLETLAGWSPGSAMSRRYGRAAARERAIESHKRNSPLSRL